MQHRRHGALAVTSQVKSDILDWHGDHPHTNFHTMFDALVDAGFFLEVLGSPLTCFDAMQVCALSAVLPRLVRSYRMDGRVLEQLLLCNFTICRNLSPCLKVLVQHRPAACTSKILPLAHLLPAFKADNSILCRSMEIC